MPRSLVILFAAYVTLLGQDAPRLSFEVASVKAIPEGAGGSGSTGMAPPIDPHANGVTFSDVSLIGILCRAYDLLPRSIQAPEWMGERRYSISAKAGSNSPEGHIQE